MEKLTKKERTELKRLTRKIRSSKATRREVLRAIDLTNRDHAQVKAEQTYAESMCFPQCKSCGTQYTNSDDAAACCDGIHNL